MTRGKGHSAPNRFAQAASAPRAAGSPQPRPTIGQIRAIDRDAVRQFNDNSVYLPNPSADAPFDRHNPQTYEQKVYGLGLAPNIPQHFWQLIKGDAGAASSVYRVSELFQRLSDAGERSAGTPYSKAIQLATMRSSDQRPRYFHTSLFSVGRVIWNPDPAGITPLPTDQITRFAAGIPAGTTSVSGNTQFGVPQYGTSQFRIMVADESGQRFVDVDVIGTRSMNFYGFGVTVFALIKEDGYEIDRQRDDNPPLGNGLIDQSVVGARIVPIRRNETKNPNNRTVSIISPAGPAQDTVLPIPPGALRVQGYVDTPGVVSGTVFFAAQDPLDPVSKDGIQGVIDFPAAPGARTDIYDIPNSNSIVIENLGGDPSRVWTFVFEVTS